ncbi:hypothetical protein LXG23DRAFT_33266 [Yarrowia lipolytica]|nr:hypothetical protein BKA91DRAFT_128569 [Yarrowia lipolytica]KAE8174564.1 hypothetical protein BKA90DRAFT_166344 [Yarrowia lipolytica]KAJ8056370.1 hypothetical protein LXG23DRAFT_33266 [Yarrowia lipolytica]RDW47618.1 hypothetical protein B0I74DRAFT_172474 [Yarrowia lipolytica]
MFEVSRSPPDKLRGSASSADPGGFDEWYSYSTHLGFVIPNFNATVHVFLRHLPPVFDIWTGYWYTQLPQPLILPINGLIGPRSNDNVLYRANSSLIVLFDRHHNHEHVDIADDWVSTTNHFSQLRGLKDSPAIPYDPYNPRVVNLYIYYSFLVPGSLYLSLKKKQPSARSVPWFSPIIFFTPCLSVVAFGGSSAYYFLNGDHCQP